MRIGPILSRPIRPTNWQNSRHRCRDTGDIILSFSRACLFLAVQHSRRIALENSVTLNTTPEKWYTVFTPYCETTTQENSGLFHSCVSHEPNVSSLRFVV